MFGASEGYVQALMKERTRAAECRGNEREWCRNEYRTEIRHG